jgi:hypothetical protein
MAMVEGKAVCEGVPGELELSFTAGNRSALRQKVTQVFELLRDPVYRYLFRVLDNRDEAEDLTQEVFLRLYAHLQKGNPVANVRAWVFRVAHNLAIDQQRKKGRLEPLESSVRGCPKKQRISVIHNYVRIPPLTWLSRIGIHLDPQKGR